MTLSFCDRLCIQDCYQSEIKHGLSEIPSTTIPSVDVSSNIETFIQCVSLVCGMFHSQNDTRHLLEGKAFFLTNETLERNGSCSAEGNILRLDKGWTARYSVPINGYLSPLLVFLTVINNSLVCIVLLKPHMRSPTNAILVAMAISDMLTGLFPMPLYIHFYTAENYKEWVPPEWFYPHKIFTDLLPTIFHTASIWLTMALAIQRYIYVCHSFKARTWCTIRNVVYGTVMIYVIALLTHVTRFFDEYPVKVTRLSLLDDQTEVPACLVRNASFLEEHIDLFFTIYYWFRVIFIHLIPCVSLVVINALLIYAMKMAQIRRMQLLRQNKKTESRKLKESNCTTLMLVAVVGLFLLVEFPLAILFIFIIIHISFEIIILEDNTMKVLVMFSNLFILLSYPLNFFIYCGMSKQFRETFKRLFTGSDIPAEKEYSQYMTLPTENGKSTAVTSAVGDETAL